MSVVMSFLFPDCGNYSRSASAFLLMLRLFFGGMLMWHGVNKIIDFSSLAAVFPDPLGMGSRISLVLAIFAEVICAAGVMAGAFYWLALIPIIFSMCVILFVVHGAQDFAAKELPVIYLVMFTLLFISGAGRFSLDSIVVRHMLHKS